MRLDLHVIQRPALAGARGRGARGRRRASRPHRAQILASIGEVWGKDTTPRRSRCLAASPISWGKLSSQPAEVSPTCSSSRDGRRLRAGGFAVCEQPAIARGQCEPGGLLGVQGQRMWRSGSRDRCALGRRRIRSPVRASILPDRSTSAPSHAQALATTLAKRR